jgi:phosphoribosylanthranilate isomerase
MVGVFLDAPAALLDEALREVELSALQLHGTIADRLPELPIYLALQVSGPESLARIAEVPFAARILLDSPKGGGSGAAFPWELAQAARAYRPRQLFLAGGLTADNVADAIRAARPDGVDVASGIEGGDGFKDAARVRAFVKAVRDGAR